MAEKVSFTSVIANRGFRYLWTNQVLVQIAYNTLNFALVIWVFKLTDSNMAVSALILAIYLPTIIFGMFAGVFVDLVDRRKIIIAVDILLALAFLLFIFFKRSYPLILINTFLVNALSQFFMPSESSSIPLLVERKQLFLANSLFSLTLFGALMMGYSVAGPILNGLGIDAIFFFGAGMLFFAFILANNLPKIKVPFRGKGQEDYFSLLNFGYMLKLTIKETKSTINFVKGKLSVLTAIGLMSAVQGVSGVLAVVMPSYVEKVLRIHATDVSYFVMIPLGLGMMAGALLIGRIFQNWPKRAIVIPAILTSGLIFILIGIVPLLAQFFQSRELPLHLSRPRYFFRAPSLSFFFAILAFLLGFSLVSIIIPCQTILQENTTEKNRGKIFAALAVLMTGFAAVPVLIAGGLSDIFGVMPIMIAVGIFVLVIGFLAKSPNLFFKEGHLSINTKEFLGLGHWEK